MARKIIADTSGIIALLDRDDRYHSAVVDIVINNNIYVPVTILPEVDYLVTKYLGEHISRMFLDDLNNGYFNYLNVDLQDLKDATKLMEKYKDLPLGIVDASLVILAERYHLKNILTLDKRHFNLIQSESTNYFQLFP